MRALTIKQPWAWLIIHGHKDIENRTWHPNYRGPFLVHAGKGLYATKGERDLMRRTLWTKFGIVLPEDDEFEIGGIVGKATINRVVWHSTSPWFEGPIGWVIEDATPLPFRSMPGQLKWFDVKGGA